jgi:hypothetical protein
VERRRRTTYLLLALQLRIVSNLGQFLLERHGDCAIWSQAFTRTRSPSPSSREQPWEIQPPNFFKRLSIARATCGTDGRPPPYPRATPCQVFCRQMRRADRVYSARVQLRITKAVCNKRQVVPETKLFGYMRKDKHVYLLYKKNLVVGTRRLLSRITGNDTHMTQLLRAGSIQALLSRR